MEQNNIDEEKPNKKTLSEIDIIRSMWGIGSVYLLLNEKDILAKKTSSIFSEMVNSKIYILGHEYRTHADGYIELYVHCSNKQAYPVLEGSKELTLTYIELQLGQEGNKLERVSKGDFILKMKKYIQQLEEKDGPLL